MARHELAAAVSEAGGLGTIAGVRTPIAVEIAAARRLTGRLIAVNLLLPFVRPGDGEAAAAAAAIVTFWGPPRRLAANTWIHQCGSVEEAKAAAAAGADAVIAQGLEAGGHVRGSTPMLELLERVRAAVKIPVIAAGGIIDAKGVKSALAAGAVAAVVGTRFLLSDESRAHPHYKQRCLDASETILTELFGLGWPGAPHRVIPNGATRRWLRGDPRGPRWIRAANRLTAPLASRIPTAVQDRAITTQRPSQPFPGPQPPTDDGPANLLDSSPLYAGINVASITDIRPAAELVKRSPQRSQSARGSAAGTVFGVGTVGPGLACRLAVGRGSHSERTEQAPLRRRIMAALYPHRAAAEQVTAFTSGSPVGQPAGLLRLLTCVCSDVVAGRPSDRYDVRARVWAGSWAAATAISA